MTMTIIIFIINFENNIIIIIVKLPDVSSSFFLFNFCHFPSRFVCNINS